MGDIRDPRLLYLKGGLFIALAALASGLLIAEKPTIKVALLLALAVWGFARAYYFAFYVVEHYVGGSERYAGLWDFALRRFRKRTGRGRGGPPGA